MITRLFVVMQFIVMVAFTGLEANARSTIDAASSLVSKQNLGANILVIAMTTVSRTQTFKIITYTVGESAGHALVKSEIERLAPKYQKAWDKNLTTAYADVFSAEELTSVARDGRSSKYFEKFSSLQGKVGEKMQFMSTPILSEFVAEVLNNVFAKVGSTK